MFTSPPYAQQRDYGAAKEKVGDWDALMKACSPQRRSTATCAGPDQPRPRASRQRMAALLGGMGGMDARIWLAAVWMVCLGPGAGLAGRLERPPCPVARVHFPLQPRAPKTAQDGAVEARGRNPRRRWSARGRRHRPRQDRNRQRDPKPSHPGLCAPHHAPQGRARCCRVAPGRVSGGAGRSDTGRVFDPGDLIYEPFCGSGTQIVAAERAGRRCFTIELDPVYCDVAVSGGEIATGKKAELD